MARVGVVGHVLLIEWFAQREFMDRIAFVTSFFSTRAFTICLVISSDTRPLIWRQVDISPLYLLRSDDAQTLPPPSATANTQHLLAPDTRVAIAFILVV